MQLVFGLTDSFAEPAHAPDALARRHAPGLSDELGDRLVILDDSGAPSLELLRFRQTLTTMPGFEVALRRRAERLSQFRHPSFAAVPAVEYLGGGHGLALLSSYTPGRRLSEVLQDARGPAFATALVQQLTPALATLHHHGDGIGHGALSASRIVITPEGHLIIVEHVLGPALERLQLTATRLYTDLGIAVPRTGAAALPRLDTRTDYFQLGLIALSLLLGRRMSSDEYPENIARTLDQVSRTSDRQSEELSRGLRAWLERALQLNGHLFESSGNAQDALHDFPEAVAERTAQQWQEVLGFHAAVELSEVVLTTPPSEAAEPWAWVIPPSDPAVAIPDSEGQEQALDQRQEIPSNAQPSSEAPSSWSDQPDWTEAVRDDKPVATFESAMDDLSSADESSAPTRVAPLGLSGHGVPSKPNDYLRWLVAALALCAIGEGFVIASLLQKRWAAAPLTGIAEINLETTDPGASVLVDGRSAGVTPLQLKIGADTRSISVVGPRPQRLRSELAVGSSGQQNLSPENGREPPAKAGVRAGDGQAAAVPAPQPSGGIRLSSPIELEVFEGDTRLGSSATGIVSVPVGRHEFELVNSVLGYRSRQFVEVSAGQVVSVAVSPPNGRVNINAFPWAEVWIDGKSVGETPIGNLSLPLGEHEIIFRHPQLGEQRRTALVRLDAVTRISANLQR